MAKYSITLNLFIPKDIVEILKMEKFSIDSEFDWRKTGLLHCTVKSLEICDELPTKEKMESYISIINKKLKNKEPFKFTLKGIDNFPDVLYAKVNSPKLIEIHKELFGILPSGRIEFEGDNYVPHVSLLNLNKRLDKKDVKNKKFGEFLVKELQLVLWDIQNSHKPNIKHRFTLSS